MLAKLLPSKSKYDLIQFPPSIPSKRSSSEISLRPSTSQRSPISRTSDRSSRASHDPENKYSVPYLTGSVGIVVNTDKVKDDIKGYKDVFQAKFKNRIVVLE